MKKLKYKKSDFLNAVKGSGGIISEIAARVGCDRRTVTAYIKRFPDLEEALADERQSFGDECEAAAVELVRSKHAPTIHFMLKTRYKDRGYVDKSEIESSGNITVNIVHRIKGEESEQ